MLLSAAGGLAERKVRKVCKQDQDENVGERESRENKTGGEETRAKRNDL